jgi:hypothetical protein
VPDRVEITEDLPQRVGGYRTLEYLSTVGWTFAIVKAEELFDEPEVLIVGHRHGWPEITAQARSVDDGPGYEGAASIFWSKVWNTLGRAAVLEFHDTKKEMNGRAA